MGIVIPLLVAGKLQANKQIDKRVQGAEGAKKKRSACGREKGEGDEVTGSGRGNEGETN